MRGLSAMCSLSPKPHADDHAADRRAVEHGSDGDVRDRCAVLLREPCRGLRAAPGTAPSRPRHRSCACTSAARRCRARRAPARRGRDTAPRTSPQRTSRRSEEDAAPAAEIAHRHLRTAVDERVLHLVRDDRDSSIENRLQMRGVEVGEREVTDLAGLAKVGEMARARPGSGSRRSPTSETAGDRAQACPCAGAIRRSPARRSRASSGRGAAPTWSGRAGPPALPPRAPPGGGGETRRRSPRPARSGRRDRRCRSPRRSARAWRRARARDRSRRARPRPATCRPAGGRSRGRRRGKGAAIRASALLW